MRSTLETNVNLEIVIVFAPPSMNSADDLVIYLTVIPQVRVGYELAIIIPYPTSASGIIAKYITTSSL